MNYKIRKMTPDDNGAVAELIRVNLKKHGLDIPGTVYFDPGIDCLYDYYSGNEKKGYYVITDETDNVVGGIGFDEFTPFENCAELQKLYLADCVKGNGLGYRLISFIEEKMVENGYTSSYLETHDNLEAAIHIYKKSGYSLIERPKEVVHNAMNNFFFKKLKKRRVDFMKSIENYVEIKRHTGEGYSRVIEFESWTAAAINYSKSFDRKNFSSVSRHNKTDETFILINGNATLAVGEPENMVTVELEKNKLYNVKRGVWHALFASPDANIIVAENSDTGADNSDTYEGAKLSDNKNLSLEGYLEIGEYIGEGYSRVVEFEGWTAAIINPSEKFKKENFVRMERHNATDEVFILAQGSARLVVGEPDNPQFVEMEKYTYYNVKKGAWHHIIADDGAKVVIVENSDTGMANSEYHSLNT